MAKPRSPKCALRGGMTVDEVKAAVREAAGGRTQTQAGEAVTALDRYRSCAAWWRSAVATIEARDGNPFARELFKLLDAADAAIGEAREPARSGVVNPGEESLG